MIIKWSLCHKTKRNVQWSACRHWFEPGKSSAIKTPGVALAAESSQLWVPAFTESAGPRVVANPAIMANCAVAFGPWLIGWTVTNINSWGIQPNNNSAIGVHDNSALTRELLFFKTYMFTLSTLLSVRHPLSQVVHLHMSTPTAKMRARNTAESRSLLRWANPCR